MTENAPNAPNAPHVTKTRREPTWLHRVALWSALVPLLVGIAAFCVWVLDPQWETELFAIAVLFGGLALTLIGAILVAILVWRDGGFGRRTVGVALLLGANVLVAAGLVVAASWIHSRYDVSIRNDADVVWRHVRLQGGGMVHHLGDVYPGTRRDVGVWFDHDGSLVLTAQAPDSARSIIVDDYVTPGIGDHAEVVLRPDGTVRTFVRAR